MGVAVSVRDLKPRHGELEDLFHERALPCLTSLFYTSTTIPPPVPLPSKTADFAI